MSRIDLSRCLVLFFSCRRLDGQYTSHPSTFLHGSIRRCGSIYHTIDPIVWYHPRCHLRHYHLPFNIVLFTSVPLSGASYHLVRRLWWCRLYLSIASSIYFHHFFHLTGIHRYRWIDIAICHVASVMFDSSSCIESVCPSGWCTRWIYLNIDVEISCKQDESDDVLT